MLFESFSTRGEEKDCLLAAHVSYLYKINQTYYCRVRVLKDLKSWFPKRSDIKGSHKTKSLTIVKALCDLGVGKTERPFMVMRSETLSAVQIKKLVNEYLEWWTSRGRFFSGFERSPAGR